MSILYKAVKRNDPTSGSEFWNALQVRVGAVDITSIASRIAAKNTLTAADIKAVLAALQEEIVLSLRDGYSVRLGDLGSFHLTLSSSNVDSADEVTGDTIKKVRVNFTTSTWMQNALAVDNEEVSFVAASSLRTSESSE